MSVQVQAVGGCVVVVLPPEVDSVHAVEVDRALRERVWGRVPPPTDIVFDLTPVQFIDSPGLTLIARSRRRGIECGVGVRVVVPTPAQRRLLETMCVERAIVYPSVHLAVLDSVRDRATIEHDGERRRSVGAVAQAPGPAVGGQG
jgi:anti-anti-sigma factor